MKNLLLSVLAIFALLSFKTASVKTEDGIIWDKTTYDFGKVTIGPAAEVNFNFTNKTKRSISVSSAVPGCSCTVSDYTKEPVPPGQKGFVKASYATLGRLGTFEKVINVTFSDETTQVLRILGTVVEANGGN